MQVKARFQVVEVANRDDGRSRVVMAPSRGSRDNTDWSRRPEGDFTLHVDGEYAEKFKLGAMVNITIDDLPEPPEESQADGGNQGHDEPPPPPPGA